MKIILAVVIVLALLAPAEHEQAPLKHITQETCDAIAVIYSIKDMRDRLTDDFAGIIERVILLKIDGPTPTDPEHVTEVVGLYLEITRCALP